MNDNNKDRRDPLVSICVFAYNHEKYIRQTLESLLMQRTSFLFEILVHDDASTDGTKKIVEEYYSIFSNIIRPVFQKENKYSISRFSYQNEYVFPKARGEYIALCDGDDYWIDPLKLQKQVDFLELNPDYGLVHTEAAKYNEADNTFQEIVGFEFNSFEELLVECTVVSSTVCLRNDLLKDYFNQLSQVEFRKWTTEDFPMWLWFIQHSKIKFLKEISAVYRNRLGSMSHIKEDCKRLHFSVGVYNVVNYYLTTYPKVKNEKKIKARYYSNMINLYFLSGKWSGINKSARIFYDANDWLNLLWIVMTLPFFYSRFIIKGSYRVRTIVFNFFNIYQIRK